MARRRTRKMPPRKPRGTTGIRPGEKLSEYPRFTLRLPPELREQLEDLARREQRPQWRVLVDAIRDYAEAKGKPQN